MPVTTDLSARRVRFDPDGEGLDFTDLANMQLFQQSQEHNMLLSGGMADGVGDPELVFDVTDPEAMSNFNDLGFEYGGSVLSPWPGAGRWYPGIGARTFVSAAGPMVMVIDEPWNGGGEELALFRLPGSLTLTTAIGDAQPRFDLVEVKLEYVDGDNVTRHFEDAVTRAPSTQLTDKERQVQLTYQIKQGVAGATPVLPAPTAGYVAMLAVFVPALHNAVHTPAAVCDLRIPFGCRAIDVDAKGFFLAGTNPWVVDDDSMAAVAAAGSVFADKVWVQCPVASKSARLLAVGVFGEGGPDPKARIVRFSHDGGAPVVDPLCELDTMIYGNPKGFRFASMVAIMDQIAVFQAGLGARVADTRIGLPLWCNGYAGGLAHVGEGANGVGSGIEDPSTKLGIEITDEFGGSVSFVRFWIAEGL